MQAYALAGGDRRLKLTPRRLNTLFLGVLIIVGGIMLVGDILFSFTVRKLTLTLSNRPSAVEESTAPSPSTSASLRSIPSPTRRFRCGMGQRIRWPSITCCILRGSTIRRRRTLRREFWSSLPRLSFPYSASLAPCRSLESPKALPHRLRLTWLSLPRL